MLAEEAARLHDACAQSLEGLVDSSQLAMHYEKAGASLRSNRQVNLAPDDQP